MNFDMTFWGALFEIFVINLILSGDNAVVIAMATLHLNPKDRKKGIFWGTLGAVMLLILLTSGAAFLLSFPFIQTIGGILLLGIAYKLLKDEENKTQDESNKLYSLKDAIKTIIIADLLMSLDNVLAVAAAARGNYLLLVLGLIISVPLVIFGSSYLSSFMRKWPWIMSLGAALLGYTAGEMILNDQSLAFTDIRHFGIAIPLLLALGVVVMGNWSKLKSATKENLVHVFASKKEKI